MSHEEGRYRILICRYGYKVSDREQQYSINFKIIQNVFIRINCNALYPCL